MKKKFNFCFYLNKQICNVTIPKNFNHLSQKLQQRLQIIEDKSKFIPNIFIALSRDESNLESFFSYYDNTIQTQKILSKIEKEMIIVALSSYNKCLYCTVSHGAMLRIFAKSSIISDQISVNYKKCDEITEKQKLMIEYGLKVGLNQVMPSDQQLYQNQDICLETQWEIGNVAAFFSFSNRIANMIDLRPNKQFYTLGRNFI